MKAMVLAAGLGLRMRPLTLLRAKPALPVLNRPLIHWTLAQLARSGVRDVVVNLHHLPETVIDAVGDGRAFGLRVHYSRERTILGTGGGPRAVREVFGDEPFLLVNGDVLFDFDLRRLAARHRSSGARATLALRPNSDPSAYGPVVTDRRGRVLSLAGLPAPARGTVSLFASVHVMDPSLLDRLPEGPSDTVRQLYAPLVAEGALLLGVRLGGAWYDLGRPSLYRDVQLRLLPGRDWRRSLVDRRAQTGGARIVRSVVGAGARVGASARVERSILWDGAVVEPGARVRGTIVATGGLVRRGERAVGVIVLPGRLLAPGTQVGGASERHGEMTWVELR
jgi:NDP-sugar pyrophosphorylase family protein